MRGVVTISATVSKYFTRFDQRESFTRAKITAISSWMAVGTAGARGAAVTGAGGAASLALSTSVWRGLDLSAPTEGARGEAGQRPPLDETEAVDPKDPLVTCVCGAPFSAGDGVCGLLPGSALRMFVGTDATGPGPPHPQQKHRNAHHRHSATGGRADRCGVHSPSAGTPAIVHGPQPAVMERPSAGGSRPGCLGAPAVLLD